MSTCGTAVVYQSQVAEEPGWAGSRYVTEPPSASDVQTIHKHLQAQNGHVLEDAQLRNHCYHRGNGACTSRPASCMRIMQLATSPHLDGDQG